MIAVIDKTPISFNEFIDWYPEISETHYELRRRVFEAYVIFCSLLKIQ